MMGRHKKTTISQRDIEIAKQFKSGMTCQEVGAIHGVSRQRIQQIISKLGVCKFDGGAMLKKLIKIPELAEKKKAFNEKCEAHCLAKWGLSLESYRALVAEYGNSRIPSSPFHRYRQQRNSAKQRGIEWGISFAEWWEVWSESGKWDERGRGYGYVMARHGDTGAYAKSNVYICTQAQNASDSYINLPVSARKKTTAVQKRGEDSPRSKLTESQVLLIRADSRSLRKIAADFGVRHSVIRSVKLRKTWAHV